MTATAARFEPHSLVLAPRRKVIVGLFLLALALGSFYVALVKADQPTSAVAWGSIALASWAGGFLYLVEATRADGLGLALWKFGSWTLLWYATAFGLATTTWSQPQVGTATEIAIQSVLRALWLVAVGV